MQSTYVIGRVGLLRYEVALLGRHGIYLSESDNYKSYLEGFNSNNLAEIYFSKHESGMKNFLDRILYISQQKEPPLLNNHAMREIDIGGNKRIVDSILSL
jgi:hypothetical protein